jgi:hypothetical protein
MKGIKFDKEKGQAQIRLHAPCGLIQVTVPIVQDDSGNWINDTKDVISYFQSQVTPLESRSILISRWKARQCGRS